MAGLKNAMKAAFENAITEPAPGAREEGGEARLTDEESKRVRAIRKQARKWKARAKEAEARWKELLAERAEMQDRLDGTILAYREDVSRYKDELASERRNRTRAENVNYELKRQLMEVKAHAYDLMKRCEEDE